ncbi:MAG: peptidoglycan-binding protein, partial [Bacteroidia bacterium]|nr:peptidoglycan-binding protein [Bacteroidia bacterium]
MSNLLTPGILLRKGDKGIEVQALQGLLNQFGYNLAVDGDFGNKTEQAVKDYQAKNGLTPDGIVGFLTVSKLMRKKVEIPTADFILNVEITDYLLPDDEYMKSITPKKTIVLHHTAGGHLPKNVVDYFNADNRGRVATAFVIGGISTRNPQDTAWDGKIIRAFDEKYWGFHLFRHPVPDLANALTLESQAIAIEICNYGFLTKTRDGRFLNWVKQEVPAEQVVTLA